MNERSPASDLASGLMWLGTSACLLLFLLFWVPLVFIVLYAIVGTGPTIVAGAVLVIIPATLIRQARAAARARRDLKLWNCGECDGFFTADANAPGNCPHCGTLLRAI